MSEDQTQTPLFEAKVSLLKSTKPGEEDQFPRFGGVASSEDTDVDGDAILRKMLDISYIAKRGYVNWDHSRDPENQLGFTTKAEVIKAGDVAKYEDLLQVPLTKSASLYVEGVLYRNSEKAMHVYNLLKSIPPGQDGSIGLSVEGGVLRTKDGISRAMIRGVAITPAPAQPDTLCRLMKSLGLDVSSAVEGVVVEDAINKGLTESEAVVRVLELRPHFTVHLAKLMVRHIFSKVQPGGN